MIWVIIQATVYLATLGFLFFLMGKKRLAVDRQLRHNLEIAQAEFDEKKKVLSELAQLSVGMNRGEELENLDAKFEEAEEAIRAEKGRLTITEAELEAIDTRLRELEELKRELEVSNMDVIKEVEMLKSQEREIANKNDHLRSQLEHSMEQLEMLFDMLSSNTKVTERLTLAKNELIECEKKCSYYEEQIALVNSKYMVLKKAYDALDIEYAQLYEKQQTAEDKPG